MEFKNDLLFAQQLDKEDPVRELRGEGIRAVLVTEQVFVEAGQRVHRPRRGCIGCRPLSGGHPILHSPARHRDEFAASGGEP